jgi:hypothetical protein
MKTLVAAALLIAAPLLAKAAPVQTFVEAPGPMGPLKGRCWRRGRARRRWC